MWIAYDDTMKIKQYKKAKSICGKIQEVAEKDYVMHLVGIVQPIDSDEIIAAT